MCGGVLVRSCVIASDSEHANVAATGVARSATNAGPSTTDDKRLAPRQKRVRDPVAGHGLRDWTSAPINVLSARSAEAEKVAPLDAGANDYVSKRSEWRNAWPGFAPRCVSRLPPTRLLEPDPAHPRYFLTKPGSGTRFDPGELPAQAPRPESSTPEDLAAIPLRGKRRGSARADTDTTGGELVDAAFAPESGEQFGEQIEGNSSPAKTSTPSVSGP